MSFKKNLFKDILTVGGYNYFLRMLSFFSSLVLARILSPEEYGIVALITVFTSFISLFVDTGYSPLIVKSEYGKLFHQSLHMFTFCIGVILYLLALGMSYPVTLFYGDDNILFPFIIISLSILMSGAMVVPIALLQKEQKYNLIGKISLAEGISRIIFTILFAWFGLSFWAIILGGLIANITKLVMLYVLCDFSFKILKLKYLLVAYRLSKSFLINFSGVVVLNYWMRRSDNLIVGKIFGASTLGLYDRAYSLLMLPLSMLSGVFSTVLLPSLKKISNNKKVYKQELRSILNQVTLISTIVAFIMIVFPESLVNLLWGEKWSDVAVYIPYFGILLALQINSSLFGTVFILNNKEKELLKVNAVVSLISIASFLFGAMFDLETLVFAYTLVYSMIAMPIFIYHSLYKIVEEPVNQLFLTWGYRIISSVIMCFAVYNDHYLLTVCLCIFGGVLCVYQNKMLFSLSMLKKIKVSFL